MQNLRYIKYRYFVLLVLALTIASCTKMAGHYIDGRTSSTFTYQLGNAAPVTLKAPTYLITFSQATAGGPLVTLVSAFNASTYDNIGLQFDATQTGTYTSSLGYFEVGNIKLQSPPGIETMKITTYNFTDNGQQLRGTLKGSFSGYMVDTLNNQVKLRGSFNITQ